MNALIALAGKAVTMSSREIAELCNKRHDNVMADITKMLKDIGLNAPDFSGTYTTAQGNTYECFNLPKDLTVTLITGYRADLRYKVVKRLEQLEGQGRLPDLSDPVVLVQLLTDHASKRIEAEQRAAVAETKVQAMSEDVQALERLSKADGSLCISDAAKALQMRPKDLFSWLRANGWIYRRAGCQHDLGYQDKIITGYLEHKVTTVQRGDGTEKITEQVRITPKGMAKLAKLMGRDQDPSLIEA